LLLRRQIKFRYSKLLFGPAGVWQISAEDDEKACTKLTSEMHTKF
jgi:hypothetical protein